MKAARKQTEGMACGMPEVGARPFAGRLKKRFLTLVRGVQRWRRLAYERRLLASLDHHQLRDIGITRVEALEESARPFWDDPGLSEKRRES